MKYNFKSFMKNAFLVLGFAFLVAGCSQSAASVSEDKYSFATPEFKAGDLYCLSTISSNVSEYDYYCFASGTEGSIVAYTSGSSDYELNSYPFTYNAGETKVNGTDWLTFVTDNNYVKAYNKNNCFKREDGKKSLSGTFSCGSDTITFSKKGKGKAVFSGHTFDITYKNDDGIVSVSDSGSSIRFYYLEDGSLLPQGALSELTNSEKLSFHVYMNYDDKGEALIKTIKGLPDGFYYELTQIAKTNDSNRADLVTVQTLLTQNPDKKFSISPGNLNNITYSHYDKKHYVSSIDEIPAEWFKGYTNLCLFKFGDNLKTKIKVGNGAFSGCTNLKEVWGSVSVNEFGENSFEGCASLEYITFAGKPTGETKGTIVKPNAFKDCSSSLIVRKSNVSTVKVADDADFTSAQDLSSASNLGTLLTSTYVGKYWKFD